MFGKLLDSTNHKSSSSQFPTVSPVHSFQACCVEHLGQTFDDAWQIIDAGDRELQTQAQSSRRDNLEPGAEDTMNLIATLYCTFCSWQPFRLANYFSRFLKFSLFATLSSLLLSRNISVYCVDCSSLSESLDNVAILLFILLMSSFVTFQLTGARMSVCACVCLSGSLWSQLPSLKISKRWKCSIYKLSR